MRQFFRNEGKWMVNQLEKKIKKVLDLKEYPIKISQRHDNVIVLEGEVPNWEVANEIAHIAAKPKKVRNVINHLSVNGKSLAFRPKTKKIEQGLKQGVIDQVDIIIVGGGISGCGIARELSKYDIKIALIEKGDDVAMGASKANNGMIHPGNAVKPGTLKAKLNIEGNRMYDKWAKELNFHFRRTGSFVASYDRSDRWIIWLSWIVGRLNKVPGMCFISPDKLLEMEPSIAVKPRSVLYFPSTAYVDGFEVTIALAENAAENGVRFYLSTEVLDVLTENNRVTGVVTNQGIIKGKVLINAAGVHADEIAAMAGDQFYTIHPRKGAIVIFDKSVPGVNRSINGRPKVRLKNTKGGGLQRTVSGNPLWGPNAVEIMDKEDTSVQAEDLEYVLSIGEIVNPQIRRSDIISYFAGVRAPDYKEDFIIECSNKIKGFIHVAGIQSPGLAAAPAIAKMVEGLVKAEMGELQLKAEWNPIRQKPIVFSELTYEEQDKLVQKDPSYGRIICRCEMVTEGEILAALRSPLKIETIDALKRRVRVTAGRCQGSFCIPRILEIIEREKSLKPEEIRKQGKESRIVHSTIRPFSHDLKESASRAFEERSATL